MHRVPPCEGEVLWPSEVVEIPMCQRRGEYRRLSLFWPRMRDVPAVRRWQASLARLEARTLPSTLTAEHEMLVVLYAEGGGAG